MNKKALFEACYNAVLAANKDSNLYYDNPNALDNPKTREEKRQFFRGMIEAIEKLGLLKEYIEWREGQNET